MAAAAGPGMYPRPPNLVLFQVYKNIEQLFEDIQLLQPYSYSYERGRLLYNCFPLTIVALGLIKDIGYFSGACADRPMGFQINEVKSYISSSLAACDLPNSVYVNSVYPSQFRQLIVPRLEPSFGTPLLLYLHNGNNHVMLLYKKTNGSLVLIDPQLVGADGSYPFKIDEDERIFGTDPIQSYINVNVSLIQFVETLAVIDPLRSIAGQCKTDLTPMWENTPPVGGRKKKHRKRKTQKNIKHRK